MRPFYLDIYLTIFSIISIQLILTVEGKWKREVKTTGTFRSRRQRDPLFPSELAGKCMFSAMSDRQVCFPDLSILDYTCVTKYGDKKTIPPPLVRNGQYKALITKFRSSEVQIGDIKETASKPFLIVQYQCNPGYELLDEAEFLFCHDNQWIQTLPICVPIKQVQEMRKNGKACEIEKGGCSHICHDVDGGGVWCDCPEGMRLDNNDHRTCLTVDVCSIDNGGCSHICHSPSQPGSQPGCSCPDNFILGSDNKTCFKASEWIVKPMDCPQVPFGHPSCVSECVHDDDCDTEKKCCSNGCAYVCLSPDLVEQSLPDVSINPPGPLEVRPGGQVNLTCTGTGFPHPSLTWYQNERRMAQGEGGLSRSDQSLTVSKTVFIKELFQSSTFRCEAVNDFGSKSAEISVTVLGPGSMPTSIRHRVRGTNITLTWKPPVFKNGNITGYRLYYINGDPRQPIQNWTKHEVYKSERTTITGLEGLSRYYFRIQAINDKGPGVLSLVFHIRTQEREYAPSVVIDGFSSPYARIELQPLESINLTCKITGGHPSPKLAWYGEGGVPVSEPRDKTPTAHLVLTHMMESTRFECIATNKMGRGNASVDVIITGPGSPPQQVQYRVVDGTNVDLSWGAPSIRNGKIIGYVVFYTADDAEAPLDEWEVEVVEKAQSTVLRNLRPYSKYSIRIQAFNELGHGLASSPVQVQIDAPWSVPEIVLDPFPIPPLQPGSKLNVTCKASGVPLPSVVWKKGGDEIVSFPVFYGNNESVAKILVIERIFESTSFTCESTNNAGTIVSDLDVVVHGPGSPPESVQATADRQTIAVTWEELEYPNGDIRGYFLYYIESANDTQALEKWWKVEINDGQRFDWKLTNLKYHTQYTVRMSAFLFDDHRKPVEGPISERAYATTSRDGEPPTIVLIPSAPLIQVLPGGGVNVTCTGVGTPNPRVKWYKNGKLLGVEVNPEVTPEKVVSSVNLNLRHMYETSSFECRATNALGTATAGVRVDVLGPGSAPREIYPIVYSNTIDIQWQEPAMINGKITGYEIGYTADPSLDIKNWTTLLVPGSINHNKLTSLLPNTNYTYMIRAFNQHGPGPWSDSQTVVTGASESKPRVSILPTVDVYKVQVGNTVNLTCIAEGFPPPTVTWHMADVVQDQRFVPESQEITLSMDNVREPFRIECIGTNPLGKDKKGIIVEVTGLGGAPLNLEGGSKGTIAHLRWDPPSIVEAEIKYYLLYYTRNPEWADERWHIVSVPLRLPNEPSHYEWDVKDLKVYTEYTFKVRPYTEEGPGPFSNIVSVNTTEKWFLHVELHPDATADVPVGGGVDILCRAKGIPAPMVTWRINDKPVSEPRPYVSILQVDPINDITMVKCVGENELEVIEKSVQLVPSDNWETNAVPTTWPDEDDGGTVLDWTDLLVDAEEGTMYTIYYTEDAEAKLGDWWQVRTEYPINMRLPSMTEDRLYYIRVRIVLPDREWSMITAPTQVLTPKFPSNVTITVENETTKLKWDNVKVPYLTIAGYTVYYSPNEHRPLIEWYSEEIMDGEAREIVSPNIHPNTTYFFKLFIQTDRKERLPTKIYKTDSPQFDRCQWAKCDHKCTVFEEEFDTVCSCNPGHVLIDDMKTCSPIVTDLPIPPTWPPISRTDEICSEEPDLIGTCQDKSIELWYFNSTLGKCISFISGGCINSENKFGDRMECLERCGMKGCLESRRTSVHLKEDERTKCDWDGDYETLGVDKETGEYYCVEPIYGKEIPETRISVNGIGGQPYCKSCELKRQHILSSNASMHSNILSANCTPEGLYEQKQCDPSSDQCWCVHPLTGEEIEDRKLSDGTTGQCGSPGMDTLKNWRVAMTDDGQSYFGIWKNDTNDTIEDMIVYVTDKPDRPWNEWRAIVLNKPSPPVNLTNSDIFSTNATTVWRMQSISNGRLGEISDPYTVIPGGPPQPVDVSIGNITSEEVKLKWSRDKDLDPPGLTYVADINDKTAGVKSQVNSSDVWDELTVPVKPEREYEVNLKVKNKKGRQGPPSKKFTFRSRGKLWDDLNQENDVVNNGRRGGSTIISTTADPPDPITLEFSGESPNTAITLDRLENEGLVTQIGITSNTTLVPIQLEEDIDGSGGSATGPLSTPDLPTTQTPVEPFTGRLFGHQKTTRRPSKGKVTRAGGIDRKGPTPMPKICKKIDVPLDLVIVLDSSNSKGPTDHRLIKSTLRDMLDKYFQVESGRVKVGFIQYSAVMAVEFALGQYNDKQDMLKHILKVPHMQGGSRTEEALTAALDIIQQNMGSRTIEPPKLVLVITDGFWMGDASLAAWQLQETGVHIIAAGVGSKIKKEELLSIVGENDNQMLMYSSWTDTKEKLAKDVVKKICEYLEELERERMEEEEEEKRATEKLKTTINIGKSTITKNVEKFKMTRKPITNTKPNQKPVHIPTAPTLQLENISSDSVVIKWNKTDDGYNNENNSAQIVLTDLSTGSIKRFNVSLDDETFTIPVARNRQYSVKMKMNGESISARSSNLEFNSTVDKISTVSTSTNQSVNSDDRPPGEVSIIDITLGEEIIWEVDDRSRNTSNWEFIVYSAEGIHWEGTVQGNGSEFIISNGTLREYPISDRDFPNENYTYWIRGRNEFGDGPLSTAFIIARPRSQSENTTSAPTKTSTTTTRTKPGTAGSTVRPKGKIPAVFHGRLAPSLIPIITEVDQVGDNTVTLSWAMEYMKMLPADWDFLVYITPDSSLTRDQWDLHYSLPNQANGFLIKNLIPEQQYTICIRARNTYGLGPFSKCVDIWLVDSQRPTGEDKEDIEETWPRSDEINDLDFEKILSTYKEVPPKFKFELLEVNPRTAALAWERDVEYQPKDTVYIFAITDNTTGNSVRLKTPTFNDRHLLAIRPNRTYTMSMISRSSSMRVIQRSNSITFRSPEDPEISGITQSGAPYTSEDTTVEGKPIITEIDQMSRTAVKIRWVLENMDKLSSDWYFDIYYTSDLSLPVQQWTNVTATVDEAQRGKLIDELEGGQQYEFCVKLRNTTFIGPVSSCVPVYMIAPPPAKRPSPNKITKPTRAPNAKVISVITKKPSAPIAQAHVLEPEKDESASDSFNIRIMSVSPQSVSLHWNPLKTQNATSVLTLTEKATGNSMHFEIANLKDICVLDVKPNTSYELSAVQVGIDKNISSSNSITFKTPPGTVKGTPSSKSNSAPVTPVPYQSTTPTYRSFTMSIPNQNISITPNCNCTCIVGSDENSRRCFFDNETIITVDQSEKGKVVVRVGDKQVVIEREKCNGKDKSDSSSSSSSSSESESKENDDNSFLLTTPVPPEIELDCPCLKPIKGDQCPPGFRFWKGRCRDINECEYGNGGCSDGCVNTPGGFYCACPPGYLRDPNDPFKCLPQAIMLNRMAQLMYFHMWHNAANRTDVTVEPLQNDAKALEEYHAHLDRRRLKQDQGKGQSKAVISNGTSVLAMEWEWSETLRKLRH